MRKAFIILIVVILLLGVSGCASVSAEQEALQVAAKYSWCIVNAINVHNALFPSVRFDYDITLEEAKEELIGYGLWPAGLLDEEERAAWELIVYKDYVAELIPAAQEALQGGNKYESGRVKIANATIIAAYIDIYNNCSPNDMLPDDVTLAEVKEKFGERWSFLTETEAAESWELIEIKDGVATVKRKLSI